MSDEKHVREIHLRSISVVITFGIFLALPVACNKDKGTGAGGGRQNVQGPGGNSRGTSTPAPADSGAQTVDGRMRDFFQKEHAAPATAALTQAQLESLSGTWEARYVSFEFSDAPVDVATLGAIQFKIEKSSGDVVLRSLDDKVPSRALTLDGNRIRAAKIAGKPDMTLRLEGGELVGEVTDKDVHAEFRGVRK